jgi:hypothetical protein
MHAGSDLGKGDGEAITMVPGRRDAAEDDASRSAEFQRRMASWSPGTEVRNLQGADHMAMLSKPTDLSDLLVEVANKYSCEAFLI